MSADSILYSEKSQGLAKNLRVRSTCNACQQAKIRCSHDRPSCHRCLKQDIPCIYSVSRRLGRPSRKGPKKVGDEDEQPPKKRHEERRITRPRDWTREGSEGNPSGTAIVDTIEGPQVDNDFEESSMIDFIDGNQLYTDEDGLDFSTESWMRELDCGVLVRNGEDMNGTPAAMESENIFSEVPSNPTTGEESTRDLDPLDKVATSRREGLAAEQDTPMQNAKQFLLRLDTVAALDANLRSMGDPIQPQHLRNMSGISDSIYDFTSDDSGLGSALSISNDSCNCYESVLRELLKTDSSSSQDTAWSIDTTLKCQEGLQILVNKVLQCRTCSQKRSNLLMLLIVSIDSLISTFETTLSSKSQLWKESSVGDFEPQFSSTSMRGYGFKSFLAQIEACPLLVGSYRVRVEEKTYFLKQLLHSRLCALSSTIRRVRLHVHQNPQASSSKARLMMIMESDRRLQLTIMKLKLWNS